MFDLSFHFKRPELKKVLAGVLVVALCLSAMNFGFFNFNLESLMAATSSEDCITTGDGSTKGNATIKHKYNDPVFVWAADRSACAATFVCNLGDSTETVMCDVTRTVKTPATVGKRGVSTYTASVKMYDKTFTNSVEVENIPAISKVELSKTEYVYSGKAKKPAITVVDENGLVLDPKYYVVVYSSNKNVGTATVKVGFGGNDYTGIVSKEYEIAPTATKISKLTPAEKAITVKWTAKKTQVSGYEIQYSTSSKFTASKTKSVTVSKKSTSSYKISKLSAKKTYYVRIRTYKTVEGEKYYSSWSSVKSVKTK